MEIMNNEIEYENENENKQICEIPTNKLEVEKYIGKMKLEFINQNTSIINRASPTQGHRFLVEPRPK